jgi:hypothetical protein
MPTSGMNKSRTNLIRPTRFRTNIFRTIKTSEKWWKWRFQDGPEFHVSMYFCTIEFLLVKIIRHKHF